MTTEDRSLAFSQLVGADVKSLLSRLAALEALPPFSWKALHPDISALAPSADQPVVTVLALGSSAATSIPSSSNWWREKRTGVAENVLPNTTSGGQTSTATLDVSGSTRFDYIGTGLAVGTASNPGQYVTAPMLPGGTTQNAYQLMGFATIFTGDTLTIRNNVVSATGAIGRVVVNGKRVQLPTNMFASQVAAGSGSEVKLVFPTVATRKVQVYGLNGGQGRFGGTAGNVGATFVKPSTRGFTLAVVGDSYTMGHSLVQRTETWMWQTGFRLGFDTIMNFAIGGTGFVRTINAEAVSNFAGRRDVVAAENPDVVILSGGRNDDKQADGVTVTTVAMQKASVEAEIDYYKTTLGKQVFVTSTASQASQSAVRQGIIAACMSRGVPFIDANVDGLAKIADGIHPTYDAHQALGDTIASGILAVVA